MRKEIALPKDNVWATTFHVPDGNRRLLRSFKIQILKVKTKVS
jgi:hypothetical protein